MEYRLTRREKAILTKWGFKPSEFNQIQDAGNDGDFRCHHFKSKITRRVSAAHARKLLGHVQFISGLSRAAFHWTATRENEDLSVTFDCSNMFK